MAANKESSHIALIWKVFALLSVVTIVEVILGIYKPDILFLNNVLGTSWLNWIFLGLTLFKAYYIAWYFMHLKEEKKWFRRAIVWSLVTFILYLSFYLLYEGSSAYESVNLLFK